MKHLYKFYWDCGRMGDVEGVFVADEAAVVKLWGKRVYFGEILGKHSEIEGIINTSDIILVDTTDSFINEFERLFPCGFGYNPLEYYEAMELDDAE